MSIIRSDSQEIMGLLEKKGEHMKQENEIKRRLQITYRFPKFKQYFQDGRLIISPYRVIETENFGVISLTDWKQGEHLTLLAADAEYVMFKRQDDSPMFIVFYREIKEMFPHLLLEIDQIKPKRALAEKFPTEQELEMLSSLSE